jgi:hypothetical protein
MIARFIAALFVILLVRVDCFLHFPLKSFVPKLFTKTNSLVLKSAEEKIELPNQNAHVKPRMPFVRNIFLGHSTQASNKADFHFKLPKPSPEIKIDEIEELFQHSARFGVSANNPSDFQTIEQLIHIFASTRFLTIVNFISIANHLERLSARRMFDKNPTLKSLFLNKLTAIKINTSGLLRLSELLSALENLGYSSRDIQANPELLTYFLEMTKSTLKTTYEQLYRINTSSSTIYSKNYSNSTSDVRFLKSYSISLAQLGKMGFQWIQLPFDIQQYFLMLYQEFLPHFTTENYTKLFLSFERLKLSWKEMVLSDTPLNVSSVSPSSSTAVEEEEEMTLQEREEGKEQEKEQLPSEQETESFPTEKPTAATTTPPNVGDLSNRALRNRTGSLTKDTLQFKILQELEKRLPHFNAEDLYYFFEYFDYNEWYDYLPLRRLVFSAMKRELLTVHASQSKDPASNTSFTERTAMQGKALASFISFLRFRNIWLSSISLSNLPIITEGLARYAGGLQVADLLRIVFG